jgi:hypothetical protein
MLLGYIWMIDDLIQLHTGQAAEAEAAAENEQAEMVVPSSSEALQAVELITSQAKFAVLYILRTIRLSIRNQQRQQTLEGWFT